MEENMDQKRVQFADAVSRHLPDVVALQEINQNNKEEEIDLPDNLKMVQDAIPLRRGNYLLSVLDELKSRGADYQAAWLPIKIGYDIYDEGLAVLSRKPILETDNILISRADDYDNWRTRRALGIRTEDGWFYTVHMNWWNDPDEPFAGQWKLLENHLKDRRREAPVYLMGDFNGDAFIRNETYDLIQSSGWLDTYNLAEKKDSGITVQGSIDGWENDPSSGRRIDQIWTDRPVTVKESCVIFNGKNEPAVSDHYGILISTEN